jgi:hypothetical protein
MSDIIGYRLISGEHVIGELKSETESTVELKNAVTIDLYQTQNGGVGVNLTPMKYFSEDKDVVLKNDHIMFDFILKTDILNEYNKVFGSGLIVPKKEGLII